MEIPDWSRASETFHNARCPENAATLLAAAAHRPFGSEGKLKSALANP
jgi:hypothetical protein